VSLDNFDPLPVIGTTPEQMRDACVTLADQALIAARGDQVAARESLRTVLEAIGAIPSESGPSRSYRWGERP
jgi:hypothetical protein